MNFIVCNLYFSVFDYKINKIGNFNEGRNLDRFNEVLDVVFIFGGIC